MCFIKLSNTYSSDKRGHAVFYKMFFYKRNHDAFCNITDIYFKYWISNLTLKKWHCIMIVTRYIIETIITHVWVRLVQLIFFISFIFLKRPITINICYLDVNWLIPKISACRARIWSLLASERSERVTNFIFCRAGWYFSVSIIFTFRWHIYHP